MKMEINTGIPLNELPPLSVELKFAQVSSFYVPSKVISLLFYVFNINCCLHKIKINLSLFFDSFSERVFTLSK